jgi:hypothetical protein
MSDDLVKRICKTWIEDGRSDDCFWEGWPENPTPDDSLTPGMVLARIEELEAKLAKVEALMDIGFAEYKRRLAKAVELVEEAYSEGFAEGYDGGWIGGDYRKPWKKSALFTTLAELKAETTK